MIVKKVVSDKVKGKAASIADLVNYLTDPGEINVEERVLHRAGRGFLSDQPAAQREEMIALAGEAVRSKNPVNHYIMSWREGEHPSVQQVDDAVSIFLAELGLSEHQCIYALHGDTDNIHLHLAVNRVHPDTLKVHEINRGFDVEACHRAIAKIEHEQGWQSEKRARYVVLENGELGREHDKKKSREPSQQAQDFEARTGTKSAERIAIEKAAPILEKAATWRELHDQLAAQEIEFLRQGSGAVLMVNGEAVKASAASRHGSLAKLQKRLGPYQPAKEIKPDEYHQHAPKSSAKEQDASSAGARSPDRLRPLSQCRLAILGKEASAGVLHIDARIDRRAIDGLRRDARRGPDEPIDGAGPGWPEYAKQRRIAGDLKAAEKRRIAARQADEKADLQQQQRERREQLFAGKWKGRGEALNAARSVLAAEQASQKAALKERHEKERADLLRQHPAFPDFEGWLRKQKRVDLADEYRHKAQQVVASIEPALQSQSAVHASPQGIRDFEHQVVGAHVHYTRRGGAGGVSFVDKGKSIDIHDWRNRDSTLAALQLSAQKWGSFTVTGNDEYKALCVQLAAQHGFRIANPELQESIEQERQRIQQERAQAMKSEQLKQFERYAEAVGAERYRVTSIKMKSDGSRLTFILDKQGGVSRGFTTQEIAQRMTEMLRLQSRGENLYYTPLSEGKHHILIDDMSMEKLQKLVQDGYKPAAVLESSPGNYQAILTVPKLGTPHDKDVGNRLSDALNRQYGDPKLSGAIHPHRAPGFQNRKPKHQREDGSYPQVKLRRAECRECTKTLELSRQIDAEYAQRAAEKAAQKKAAVLASDAPSVPLERITTQGLVHAYYAHRRDVLSRQKGDIDLSRVDSMIAVRLRVTGHGQGEIESAIRQCAPATRPHEEGQGRDWNDYAQRTARYAFSAAADRQAAELGKYRAQWQSIEAAAMPPAAPARPPIERAARPPEIDRGGYEIG